MAYPAKIDAALEVLAGTDIWRWSYAPPVYRLLWSLGIPVRPPHFTSFATNFLVMAGVLAVYLFVVFWIIDGHYQPIWHIAEKSVAISVVASLINAAWVRYRQVRYKLPDWSEIGIADRFD